MAANGLANHFLLRATGPFRLASNGFLHFGTQSKGEPPRPYVRGFRPIRSVGIAWHHRLHATATNWSVPEGPADD